MEIKNKQPMQILSMNPIALKYSKKYIWGVNQNSIKLFFRLCNLRIYIDGFVDDELGGETIYHKRIYRTEDIISHDSICFVSSLKEEGQIPLGITACSDPVIINPELNYTNSYIYGSGYMGELLLNYLREYNIEIKGFIDSDTKKVNTNVQGVNVYDKSIIKSLDKKATVIEAGKYYREIDSIVRDLNGNLNRFCFNNAYVMRDNTIWIYDGVSFDGIINFDDNFQNKKIYLCGVEDNIVNEYFKIFKLLDFEDVCIAKWAEDIWEDDEIYCIEDAVLDENSLIVFCCEVIDQKDLKKLFDLGLEKGKDFCDIRCSIWEKVQYIHTSECQGIQILDINLGYTRDMQGEFPGIAVFGNNYKDDYKIAVLGGSTATSGYFRIKSWPEYLYEKYATNHVTLFNAAVEGYTSAQELIKLMRDIVRLKPNLVIVYDGYNDVASKPAFPDMPNIFAIPYMKTILEYASKRLDGDKKNNIFCGISTLNSIEEWLKNIEYMHAVCEVNNINFLSFVQPLLYSKPAKQLLKRERILLEKWDIQLGDSESVRIPVRNLRKTAHEICNSHEYIYDLSHIFDKKNVYMDFCHVFENGNKIIADEIYRVINRICL